MSSPTKEFYSQSATKEDIIHLAPGAGGRHILVSLDNSTNSWNALEFAVKNIIKPADCLTIFTVLDPRDAVSPKGDDQENYRTSTMVGFYESTKKVQASSGVEFKFRVHAVWAKDCREVVVQKINDEQGKYDMLVIGTRGKSSLSGVIMGSVSNYLLANSPIPVIVVRQNK
jgi:nucleotide-binding universal stress UspA family protein